MPRLLALFAGAGLAFAASAQAETTHPISGMIAENGLAATIAHYQALEAPTPEDHFALGGAHFLRAVESSLQSRWRMNATPVEFIPILRLPTPPNPNPEPFQPEMVRDVFTGALAELAEAEAALARIPEDAYGPEFGMRIDLNDLWFDVNMNGRRDDDGPMPESLAALAADLTGGGAAPEVRFDIADVAWLRAYVGLLSGVSHVVLAVDPTEAIRETVEARAAIYEFNDGAYVYNGLGLDDPTLDQLAIVITALRQPPDPEHMRAALAGFEAMIAYNDRFWDLVARETDNEAEWLPNPNQISALTGQTLPREIAKRWGLVLDELDAVLKGELLIPYWQSAEGVGVNMRSVFETPGSLDVLSWLQGSAAAPHLQKGPLADGRSLDAFFDMAQGDAVLLALWLN